MKKLIPIPPEAAGQRADVFVARSLAEYSRSFWRRQFDRGGVRIAGKPIKPSFTLEAGELEVHVPTHHHRTITLPILYQDADVVVVNKPAGILTHAKGALAEEATVADFLQPLTTEEEPTNRPGIVHRLDRATSGVLIAAKHPKAKAWLQKQFSQRKVRKTYLALVEGTLDPHEAILKLPIERNPKAPQKFRVGPSGKPAETAYVVKEALPRYTFVELKPHTGRTHQLRVHMAHLGHPIVGDRLYGHEEKSLPGRIFLHASSLEITLPSHERRTFHAALPDELTQFLAQAK